MNPAKSGKMSVLSSIPTRFRVVLIGVACLGISLISQAQIVLNVSGGGPLTINITTGADFEATGDTTSPFAAVIFENFWDNYKSGERAISGTATTATVELNGISSPARTGAGWRNDKSAVDFTLGFWDQSISSGDTVTLSAGTRVTGNLSLNYTSINATGTAFIADNTGTAISNSSVTWTHTAVPEPSTYAAISGLVCLGGAIARRRFKRS